MFAWFIAKDHDGVVVKWDANRLVGLKLVRMDPSNTSLGDAGLLTEETSPTLGNLTKAVRAIYTAPKHNSVR